MNSRAIRTRETDGTLIASLVITHAARNPNCGYTAVRAITTLFDDTVSAHIKWKR